MVQCPVVYCGVLRLSDRPGNRCVCAQVVKLMTRMGKTIPEHKSAAMPAAASASMQTASNVGSAGPSAMKKVYCTPKINFIGESLPLYIHEQMLPNMVIFCTWRYGCSC